MLIIGCLGFGSGIPFTLVFITFTYKMAESGVNLRDIGLFGVASLPFTVKFIWSPVVDGLKIPILTKMFGQRKSWLILSQIALAIIISKFGFLDPKDQMKEIVYLALILAFVSATYDIAYDAIRVEILDAEEQGAGAGVAILGYRVGMLMSAAVALLIADIYSWKITFIFIACTYSICLVATFFAPEPENMNSSKKTFVQWIRSFVVQPFLVFIRENKNWILIISFAVTYKMGEALMGKMMNPFYFEMGFTKSEVAEITKLYGFVMSIIGGMVGGWAVYKIGVLRSLLIFGVLQTLANLTFVWQAIEGHNLSVLTAVITLENLTGSMATAAFVGYLSSLCHIKFTATHYALLTSFASMGRWMMNVPSGYLVDAQGLGLAWEEFFVITSLVGIPSLFMIKYLKTATINK